MSTLINPTVVNKLGRGVIRAMPLILSAVGAAGVIVTAVLTAKATPKALKLCKELKDEKGSEPETREYIRAAWKPYIPAAIAGVSTMTLILASGVIGQKQQVVMAGAYAFAQKSLYQYRDKVKEVFGKDADQQIKELIARDNYKERKDEGCWPLLIVGDGASEEDKVLFYESYHDQYFRATKESVIEAQYHLNRNLALKGSVSLNEFFLFLGLDEMAIGDKLWWDVGNDSWDYYWIDFENFKVTLEDGLECYIINYEIPPEPEEDYQLA